MVKRNRTLFISPSAQNGQESSRPEPKLLALVCLLAVFCVTGTIAASAQIVSFTSLASFDGTDGTGPEYSSLVQGPDGNFYGITNTGGAGTDCYPGEGCGTVFRVTPSGTLTTLYNFCSAPSCDDGDEPATSLVQGSDGNLYGTTERGGVSGWGVVFAISPAGTLSTVHSFCLQPNCADGSWPTGALTLGNDGNFYGTTLHGGAVGACPDNTGCGTVFKITPSGALTTLHSFQGVLANDGAYPRGSLLQGSDGNFYGVTWRGGGGVDSRCHPTGCGTIFQITPAGAVTTLYSFCPLTACADGDFPYAGLIQASDGNFYGMTTYGGNSGCGSLGCGTAFRLTPAGALTTLYTFCSQSNCADGRTPFGALLQSATDGNLYGTTGDGGAHNDICPGGCGTLFRLTTAGALTTLHIFSRSDGAEPWGGLVQTSNGNFYGTTYTGGAYNSYGTVFSLAIARCATCRP